MVRKVIGRIPKVLRLFDRRKKMKNKLRGLTKYRLNVMPRNKELDQILDRFICKVRRAAAAA